MASPRRSKRSKMAESEGQSGIELLAAVSTIMEEDKGNSPDRDVDVTKEDPFARERMLAPPPPPKFLKKQIRYAAATDNRTAAEESWFDDEETESIDVEQLDVPEEDDGDDSLVSGDGDGYWVEGTDGERVQLVQYNKGKEKTVYSCQDCGRTFTQVRALRTHWNQAHKEPHQLSCDQCDFVTQTTNKRKELIKHMSQMHKSLGSGDHECGVCGRLFSSPKNLRAHELNVHIDQERPYQCPHCTYAARKAYKLRDHMDRLHPTQERSRDFHCDQCYKSFFSERDLRKHIQRVHLAERQYACGNCTATFVEEYSLTRHLRTVHCSEKTFSCDVCGKCFVEQRSLTRHSHVHSDNKPYVCPVCEKGFVDMSGLVRHQKTHEREATIRAQNRTDDLWPCRRCPASFSTRALLRKHESVHNTDRNTMFACEVCRQAFLKIEDLDNHECPGEDIGEEYEYIEDPNAVMVEGTENAQGVEGWVQREDLNAGYACAYCDAVFSTMYHKLDHETKEHCEDYPFQCGNCCKGYDTEKELDDHLDSQECVTEQQTQEALQHQAELAAAAASPAEESTSATVGTALVSHSAAATAESAQHSALPLQQNGGENADGGMSATEKVNDGVTTVEIANNSPERGKAVKDEVKEAVKRPVRSSRLAAKRQQ